MRPITNLQNTVLANSDKLPPLTPKQREWAVSHAFEPKAYVNKINCWCSECGQDLPKNIKTDQLINRLDKATITCPHCGKELVVKDNSVGSIQRESYYYTIITTCDDFQVFRHFVVTRYSQRTCESAYVFNEAVQIWLDKNGKETILARKVQSFSRYYDNWIYSTPLSIKRINKTFRGLNRYDINAYFVYPHRNYIPSMKKHGFNGNFFGMTPSEFSKLLLSNNDYEFLLKTKQTEILKYMLRRGKEEIPHKYAVNICNRNNYKVKDADLWFDMLDALQYLGKDLHNPHYICPSDLKAAHDRYVKLKSKKQMQEMYEKRRDEALKCEQQYRDMKEKFFDLVISNKNIVIKPLRSVEEFLEEGTYMHHCVYTNGYYKRQDCLILSAKDMDGNRIETIEVNLEKFNIVQSRGRCNSRTPLHDEIVNLINDNMGLIADIQLNKINEKAA